MSLKLTQRHALMCITQDNLPLSHLEQVRQLCDAGAKWIQLRMKRADATTWLETAKAAVAICHAHHAVCIINDSLDLALTSGADGVHLGRTDGSWPEARQQLGSDGIVGGTVNNEEDADLAIAAGCLDYAGVGPWRFTTNKNNLAPLLGPDGVRALVAHLGDLPAWAIGGIEAADLRAVRATGARGAAVSSSLFRTGTVRDNYRALQTAWASGASSS
jgi:thiamine-phosphate pyrophosphorylase